MPTVQKTIDHYDRLRSTSYGNPRFRFTFTDGSAHDSMGNAGWCYAVGNVPECARARPSTSC
jgi:hypothetical protein